MFEAALEVQSSRLPSESAITSTLVDEEELRRFATVLASQSHMPQHHLNVSCKHSANYQENPKESRTARHNTSCLAWWTPDEWTQICGTGTGLGLCSHASHPRDTLLQHRLG